MHSGERDAGAGGPARTGGPAPQRGTRDLWIPGLCQPRFPGELSFMPALPWARMSKP
jgi:hypothetical protein